MNKYTLALTGNPNCGKTTLFNALTGAKQKVGNWPGVTVERIEGNFQFRDHLYELIDLPGIYSFSAYSLDEKVSREFILLDKPDLVINIVDATNLERTLYLTTQLLEMRIPMIVVLNMMDLARQKKTHIEIEHLATHLDCPVIPMVASKKTGLNELIEAIHEYVGRHHISNTKVTYDSVVEDAIEKISARTIEYSGNNNVDNRWLAIKLLESDDLARKMTDDSLREDVEEEARKVRKHTHHEIDIVIADGRYGFIHGLTKDVVHRDNEFRKNISDFIDRIVLNRVLSVPIFLFVMYLVFMLTINVGKPFIDFFSQLTRTIFVDGFGYLLTSLSFPAWLTTILADGFGGGIQSVSTFIPPVFFMFLSLSILEDSGYMSRAAFVMDRFMRLIGLPGKAFIPMLVGFGCNVPAIMATRTLDNKKDRILTILINPFMSCGARLPVYAFFAAAFFPAHGGIIIFSIYLIGILLAILSGFLFKNTILKGETSTFVMELPPYHIPTVNGILLHTWQRLKGFLIRAGKIIILVVVILTVINSIGKDGSFGNEDSDNSLLSVVGKQVTPLMTPMGITRDNWPATVGLITGVFAKETVVGTLDALYNQMEGNREGEDGFKFWQGIITAFRLIPEGFREIGSSVTDPGGLQIDTSDSKKVAAELDLNEATFAIMKEKFGDGNTAFAYLLFILVYMPCIAVIAIIAKEAGKGWALLSVSYLTLLAWIISTLFYQVSTFSIHPDTSFFYIILCLFMLGSIFVILKLFSRRKILISEVN